MGLDGKFVPDDGGDLRLAESWRSDQEAVIQAAVVLKGGSDGDCELVYYAPLPGDMRKRGWRTGVKIVLHGGFLRPQPYTT